VFGSVVASAFQIIFRAKMHVNDIFLFFKNYFWYQHIKTIQNIQTILNFNKKKILIFLGTQPQPYSQRALKYTSKLISYLLSNPCGNLIDDDDDDEDDDDDDDVQFHGLNFKTECSSFSFKLLPKTGSNCCSQ